MTQYIVAAAGTAGDVYPFIEICRHLKQHTKKATLITNPYFKSEALKAGLAFHPFGTLKESKELFHSPTLWAEDKGFVCLWKTCIERNIDAIRDFVAAIEALEDIVIICHFNLLPLAELARARNRQLTIVACYLSPGTIRSHFGKLHIGTVEIGPSYPASLKNKLFSWIDKNYFNADILPNLNRHRSRLQLPPVDNFLPHIQTAADAYVTLFPKWYRKKELDWPTPLVEADFLFHRSIEKSSLSEKVKRFLEQNGSPILFTAGTANSTVITFFREAAHSVDALGRSAIFLTKHREQLPRNLGKNILWLRYFDLGEILRYAAICVSHGGIGTIAEAMRAGVPQIIVPFAHDQFDNARITMELGIARMIPAKQLNSENMTLNLKEILLSANILAKSKIIAKRFKSNDAGVVLAEKLIRMVGQRRLTRNDHCIQLDAPDPDQPSCE